MVDCKQVVRIVGRLMPPLKLVVDHEVDTLAYISVSVRIMRRLSVGLIDRNGFQWTPCAQPVDGTH
jgi:hypothetical protein